MLKILVFLCSCLVSVGGIVYMWGHPRRKRVRARALIKPPKRASNRLDRYLAHSAQTVNFFVHRVTAKEMAPRPIAESYVASVRKAFSGANLFITTGSPHSRAFYLRNFAWFYPNLLDPATIVDERDLQNRLAILERSLGLAVETMGTRPYTTTIVPLSPGRFSTINYVTPPSDSLLGVLAGLEQLLFQDIARDVSQRVADFISQHQQDLEREIRGLRDQLESVPFEGKKYLLLDANGNRSSATDTRLERKRFVVSANVWSTFYKAEQLGLMNGKVFERLGLDAAVYKRELLELFGSDGFICDSLEKRPASDPAYNVTLDFAHIYRGFWNCAHFGEQRLFLRTAEIIFADPAFRDNSGNCYFLSKSNPPFQLIHSATVPAYHGRTVWPSFNVEFADRLLDFSSAMHHSGFRDRAFSILRQIKEYVEKNGCYSEVLGADGSPYRTWIYRSAIADSWFSRFASVWHKAFPNDRLF
jgi:hypothetical protein